MASVNPFAEEIRRRQAAGQSQGPDNPFQQELQRRQLGDQDLLTGARQGLETFFNNVIQVPELAGQALLNIESPLSMLRSETSRQIQEARTGEPVERRTLFQDLTGREPPERLIPLTGEDVMAAGDVAAQVPGALVRGEPLNLSQRFQQATEQGQALTEANPAAATVGQVAGDVATLATGRAPFARRIGDLERTLASRLRPTNMDPGVRRAVNQALNSGAFKRLARGAGRSAETGLDAAALAALQGEDPSEAFGFGAGAQMVGSGVLSGFQETLSRVPGRTFPVKLAVSAAAGAALIQMFKTLTPGGRDRILESEESAFNKILFGIGAGALATAAGSGRIRSENFPKLTDALSASLRGGAISSLLRTSQEDERVEPLLRELANNPQSFNAEARRRIQRAIEREDVDLSRTIDSLEERNRSFRRRLQEARRPDRFAPAAVAP